MTAFTHLLLAAFTLHWTPQDSRSLAGLRGLSAVSSKVVWASGTKGTVLRTIDGGQHWDSRSVPALENLDFRDVRAFDDKRALIMSSGAGNASRVYLTTDGGITWKMVLTNPDATGFFDAVKFWDHRHGILLGDPVAGHFAIFVTDDGGLHWRRARQPDAVAGEGAFAASGTCLTVLGRRQAWFGTGGPGVARVFYTSDRGSNWSVAATPLAGTTASAGIFSLVFLNALNGVAVGGDYQKPADPTRTLAISRDGGRTWTAPPVGIPLGFRSAVTYVKRRRMLIAAGTPGIDFSLDVGVTWTTLSTDVLNALAAAGNRVWAVGPKGLIVTAELK